MNIVHTFHSSTYFWKKYSTSYIFLFSAETKVGEENDVEKRSGGKQTIFIFFYVEVFIV